MRPEVKELANQYAELQRLYERAFIASKLPNNASSNMLMDVVQERNRILRKVELLVLQCQQRRQQLEVIGLHAAEQAFLQEQRHVLRDLADRLQGQQAGMEALGRQFLAQLHRELTQQAKQNSAARAYLRAPSSQMMYAA